MWKLNNIEVNEECNTIRIYLVEKKQPESFRRKLKIKEKLGKK